MLAVGVVDIDNAAARAACACAFKQAALGGEIIFHGVVEIEMITGQICEDARSKTTAPKAIKGKRVRTAFQNGVGAACPNDFGKEALQVERFGRSGSRGIGFARGAIFDGAKEAAIETGGMNDGVQKKARGGLAVGSCDSDELQLVRRTAVEVCSNDRQRLARIRHVQPSDGSRKSLRRDFCVVGSRVQRLAALCGGRHFADDGRCAALCGSADEAIAVRLFAAYGDKKRTGPSLATVVNDRRDLRLGVYQRPLDRSTRYQFLQFHSSVCKYRTPTKCAQFCGGFMFRRVQRDPAGRPASLVHYRAALWNCAWVRS